MRLMNSCENVTAEAEMVQLKTGDYGTAYAETYPGGFYYGDLCRENGLLPDCFEDDYACQEQSTARDISILIFFSVLLIVVLVVIVIGCCWLQCRKPSDAEKDVYKEDASEMPVQELQEKFDCSSEKQSSKPLNRRPKPGTKETHFSNRIVAPKQPTQRIRIKI